MEWLPELRGHRLATGLLAVATFCALCGAAFAWAAVAPSDGVDGSRPSTATWYLGGQFVAVCSYLLLVVRGYFRIEVDSIFTGRVAAVVASVAMAVAALLVVAAVGSAQVPGPRALAVLTVLLAVAAAAVDVLGRRRLRRAWLVGRLRDRALIYGSDQLAASLALTIEAHPEHGIDVVGFFASTRALASPLAAPVFEPDPDEELAQLVADSGADRLIIGPGTAVGDASALRLARRMAALGRPVFVAPRLSELGMGVDPLAPGGARSLPLLRLQRSAHPQLSIRLKRAFDATAASVLLVVLAPLMAVVALLVRFSGPGPILFHQERVGRHGTPIVIHKFRSMVVNDGGDAEWTADDRVTAVGRWLRRLSLDELPQLWSVMVGDMSLVGPRPERPAFVTVFRHRVPGYDDRLRMPVGITGLAQIAGLRGDTSITERVRHDNLYIDQWSFRSDLRILARTLSAVVRQAVRPVPETHRSTVTEGSGPTIDLTLPPDEPSTPDVLVDLTAADGPTDTDTDADSTDADSADAVR
ncbi:MAG: sugar transferase [Actinomycetota bacterium]